MKKTIALILTILLILTAFPVLASNTPRDAASLAGALRDGRIPSNSWAIDHIMKANGAGIIPESMYKDFKADTTREEFCKMALYYLSYATGKTVDELLEERGLERDPGRFTDTRDPDLLAAAALGITAGIGGDKFGPDVSFNRAQAATFLRNTCRLLDGYEPENAPAAPFDDMDTVPSYAKDAVNFAYTYKIMVGDGKSINPLSPFQRQASVTTFSNMMGPRSGEIFVRESDGVTFDPATDIIDGYVKPEVVRALMDAILYNTHIYFDASGQMWMDITFPELPNGWEWRINTSFRWSDDKHNSVYVCHANRHDYERFQRENDPKYRIIPNTDNIHIPIEAPVGQFNLISVQINCGLTVHDDSITPGFGCTFASSASNYLMAGSWQPYPEEGLKQQIFDFDW